MKDHSETSRTQAALQILDDAELEAVIGGTDLVTIDTVCHCACGETACAGSCEPQ